MQTFVQKSKSTQQNNSSKSAPHNSKRFEHVSGQNHNLFLQRKNENPISRLMLKTSAEEEKLDKKSLSSSEVNSQSFSSSAFQTKLSISSPNDSQELEADRVADAVVNSNVKTNETSGHSPFSANSSKNLQRAAETKAESGSSMPEDEFVAPKLNSSVSSPSPAISTSALNSNNGVPLSQSARNYMEPRFGYDFSSVRIHTNPEAIQMASSINAAAFTHGQHIYFNGGRYDDSGNSGRKLLAHELTHVIQQGGGDNQVARDKIHRSLLNRPEIHANSSSDSVHKFWRAVEAHVNLRVPQQVRIYNNSGSQDFQTSAGTGTRTSRLISRSPYKIIGKRPTSQNGKVGKWGLQFFARFHGGIGFHSNICYPRPRRIERVLTVDGTPRSHGCIRLHHGDSETVYNALSVGSKVYIYNRINFRNPSWRP